MAQSAPARTKINTKVTQPAPGRSSRRLAGRPGPGRPPRGPRVSGEARDSVRQSARPVIELDFGILVYPPETDGEPWRAVFTENGQRKYRQGATEAKLAEKLEKVKERLQAAAANMERPGADLIRHYLDPDRLPAGDRWSRKHAHTQRRRTSAPDRSGDLLPSARTAASTPPQWPPTAPASSTASRSPSASSRRCSARPPAAGRAAGWQKPGRAWHRPDAAPATTGKRNPVGAASRRGFELSGRDPARIREVQRDRTADTREGDRGSRAGANEEHPAPALLVARGIRVVDREQQSCAAGYVSIRDS